MRIAYLGNAREGHNFERSLAIGLLAVGGHHLQHYPDRDADAWQALRAAIKTKAFDAVWWTWGGARRDVPFGVQMALLEAAREAGVPTVGIHMDRWWGLAREDQVREAAFFKCTVMATADGGHHDQWDALGVRHYWLPPGFPIEQMAWPLQQRTARRTVVFVGNAYRYPHAGWADQRADLVRRVSKTFTSPVITSGCYGQELTDMYAGNVVLGDSCLIPARRVDGSTAPMRRYCSDRLIEAAGRGGVVVHPYVSGVLGDTADALLYDHVHAIGYPVGDVDAAIEAIRALLRDPVKLQAMSATAREHVLQHHTMRHRAQRVVNLTHEALLYL